MVLTAQCVDDMILEGLIIDQSIDIAGRQAEGDVMDDGLGVLRNDAELEQERPFDLVLRTGFGEASACAEHHRARHALLGNLIGILVLCGAGLLRIVHDWIIAALHLQRLLLALLFYGHGEGGCLHLLQVDAV